MTADDTPQPPRLYGKTCSKCGRDEVGPGGILCGPCKRELESAPLYPEPGWAAAHTAGTGHDSWIVRDEPSPGGAA